MTRVRLTTLNVENLFRRFLFRRNTNPNSAIVNGWKINDTTFDVYDDDAKEITGALINDINADILCLQEVEGVDSIKRFRSLYLGGRTSYRYVSGIDGNDPRLIDVIVLSKRPIVSTRSWQHLWQARSSNYTFSRDCLEVDISMPDGSLLTVYNNHFKSMIPTRTRTRARRLAQARATKKIVTDRFGESSGRNQFAIVGDLNDYRASGGSLNSLLNWDQVEDVVERLPADDRWTHYWARESEYRQLDYLLLSNSLARRNTGRPRIERAGLPWRATRYTGPRYEGVGTDRPKASDHCPITFDLDF